MPSLDPARRLDDILRSIDLIESYVAQTGGIDLLLTAESVHRDAIERRLQIISKAAIKLGEMAERLQPEIAWRNIRGLGNTLRHDYDNVRHDIIRLVVNNELPRLAIAWRAMKAKLPDA